MVEDLQAALAQFAEIAADFEEVAEERWSIYTTISLAGSLQAPMTPLRPTVRTRTQMTVPGVNGARGSGAT